MVYGEKFLNVNNIVNEKISLECLLVEDMNNFNEFLNNIDVDIVNEAQENVVNTIFNKILDLIRKAGMFIQKFINIIKQKIISFGKKIIEMLDNLIAGKYNPSTSISDEEDYDDDFFDDDDFDYSIFDFNNESCNINEASQDGLKVILFSIDETEFDINDDGVEYINDLYNLAEKYLDLYNKNINYSEDNSDALEDLEAEYDDEKKNIIDYINTFTEIGKELNLDLQDIKNYKKNNKCPKDKGSTRNDFIDYKMITFNKDDKEILKELRDEVRGDLYVSDKYVKRYTKEENETLDLLRKTKHIYDKYQHVIAGHRDMRISSNESKIGFLIKDVDRICVERYRLLNKFIDMYFYCIKNDYKVVIKCAKLWKNKKVN